MDYNALQNYIDRLQRHISNGERAKQDTERTISDLDQEIAQLKQEMAAEIADAANRDSNSDSNAFEESVDDIQARYMRQIEEKESEIESARRTIDAITSQLTEAEKILNELKRIERDLQNYRTKIDSWSSRTEEILSQNFN